MAACLGQVDIATLRYLLDLIGDQFSHSFRLETTHSPAPTAPNGLCDAMVSGQTFRVSCGAGAGRTRMQTRMIIGKARAYHQGKSLVSFTRLLGGDWHSRSDAMPFAPTTPRHRSPLVILPPW